MRALAEAANESRYWDAVETLPRPELLRLQERRLLAMVAYAGEHSPLMQKLWRSAGVAPAEIRSVADFVRRAPFMSKDDVRRHRDEHDDPFGGLLCVPPSEVSFMGTSSGTTSEPTLFAWRWGRRDGNQPAAPGLAGDGPTPFWGATPRDLWEMGIRPGDYAVFFGIRLRGPVFRALQQVGCIPIFLGYTPADMAELANLSRTLAPRLMFPMSTPIALLLQALERETGLDLARVLASYRAVIWAGEPMGRRTRETFVRWGVGAERLFEQTSLGDLAHAHDCREHAGCHAWEDIALVELIDPVSAAPLLHDGRGELVVTSLVNDVDPLIRYRSGDLVDLSRQPCRCGRTHARFRILGRAADEVIVAGRSILPIDVWPAIESVDETAAGLFQVIVRQREMSELRLRVGYAGEPDRAELARRLGAAVAASVGVEPRIELTRNEELLTRGSFNKIPRTAKE